METNNRPSLRIEDMIIYKIRHTELNCDWVKYLPEVGNITTKARKIKAYLDKIEQLKTEIESMKRLCKHEKETIIAEVKKNWTEEEINEAIKKAINEA